MKTKSFFLWLYFFCASFTLPAQLPDSCKLTIGTNLAGLADWGTEIPFVDLMKTCREWYTKSIGDSDDPFDSGFAQALSYRADGYPTQMPQTVAGSDFPQVVATIWAITDGWPAGQYTVLWEGNGTLSFNGTLENIQQTNPHRMTFDFPNPIGGVVEMRIEESDSLNPIHHIRVLMPGTESTYESQPFYSLWAEKVDIFSTVRFMDWGQTNGWGLRPEDGFGSDTLVDWVDRSHVDYYTWTHSKGVPYEMMVAYMNQFDKDGWVCVPHSASEDYVRQMARFFRDNLEPGRHIYVEYSNEIWNFIFPQTEWANEYGCVIPGVSWPEGTVQYIQRMLDYWTDEYAGQLDRTTRVVGVFTGWLDVAQRVAFHLDTNSFDVISPTYYFGFSEDLEAELDDLGAAATVADVADAGRRSMAEYFGSIQAIKTELVDSLHKPMAFYEGGQHFTPMPFGEVPTYESALLDIQRDTAMYNMYNEWFDKIRSLQAGNEPLLLMNFAFVSARSAQYGSWGILETMDQDLAIVPAPKYEAIVDNMNSNCGVVSLSEKKGLAPNFVMMPNPTSGWVSFREISGEYTVTVRNAMGLVLRKEKVYFPEKFDFGDLPKGVYFLVLENAEGQVGQVLVLE